MLSVVGDGDDDEVEFDNSFLLFLIAFRSRVFFGLGVCSTIGTFNFLMLSYNASHVGLCSGSRCKISEPGQKNCTKDVSTR